MQFTKAAYEAEKLRLKNLGHLIDEDEFDQFFSAANGNPNVIRSIWEGMRKTPNPIAAARARQLESIGENFAADVETFGGLVG